MPVPGISIVPSASPWLRVCVILRALITARSMERLRDVSPPTSTIENGDGLIGHDAAIGGEMAGPNFPKLARVLSAGCEKRAAIAVDGGCVYIKMFIAALCARVAQW